MSNASRHIPTLLLLTTLLLVIAMWFTFMELQAVGSRLDHVIDRHFRAPEPTVQMGEVVS